MKVLMVILLLLLLLGQLRVGGQAEYSVRGLFLWARLGPVRIKVFPMKKREKPAKSKAEGKRPAAKEKKSAVQDNKPLPEKLGGALDYAKALLPLALEAAKGVYGGLRVDTLELELTVAPADPADAAMGYGQASAAFGALWEPLTQALHVKDGHARVLVDFDGGGTRVYCLASLSIRLGRLCWLGLSVGWKALWRILAVRRRQKMNRSRQVSSYETL